MSDAAMTPMHPGDIATCQHLRLASELNGEYVEILTDLMENAVPEQDGIVRQAWRYGVEFIRTGTTGYIRAEHLAPQNVNRRSVCIHLFGTEDRPR